MKISNFFKNKKQLILFILLFLTFSVFSQKIGGILTKEEMYKEFDYLIDVVDSANTHLEIYKKLMNYDLLDDLRNLRSEIDTITYLPSYLMLIRDAIELVPEGHTRLITNLRNIDWYKHKYPAYFDSLTFDNYNKIKISISKFAPKIRKRNKKRAKYHLALAYIDGDFYTLRKIKITNTESGFVQEIQPYWKLLKINDIVVDSFLKRNWKYFISRKNNRWDMQKKVFYNEDLLQNKKLVGDNVYLTFWDYKENKIKTISYVNLDSTYYYNHIAVTSLGEFNNYEKVNNKILYFDSLLYIKIPSMNMKNFSYFEEEIPKYSDSIINNIVIDIRDNNGGSDLFWHGILGKIIDTTFCRNQKLGIRNWKKLQDKIEMNFDSLPLYYDSILNQYFKLLTRESDCMKIDPDSNSIRYNGTIYLLHNKNSFSSATAFVAFASENDRMISVGINNGYLGGYGTDPFLFQLPFSKLMFTMHSTIHIPVNANSVNDYFWNKTKIKIKTTPYFETIMYFYRRFDIFSKSFLKEKDIYFRRIFESD